MVLSLASQAQTDYSIVWGLDQTLAGVSDSDNFTPLDVALTGVFPGSTGSTTYYFDDGNGGYAYRVRGWSGSLSEKYLEVKFNANSFQYNVTALSFRVKRRSASAATSYVIRSQKDGFAANIGAPEVISSTSVFEQLIFPVNFTAVDEETFTFRIYAYGTSGIQGPTSTVEFDAINITGQITAIPLPVNLTYFRAEAYGKEAQLSWETSWERNSKEFVIERSGDLREFIQIGRTPAAGNTTSRRQYSFVDTAPEKGANYYRLKMVDQDNTVEYSQVKDVIIRPDVSSILISPNPVTSRNLIRIRAYKTDANDLTLVNNVGQKIPFRAVGGESDYINLHVQNPLAPGIYILNLKQGELSQNIKILVQ